MNLGFDFNSIDTLWAHTVVYALLKHYDMILLKYYFPIGFVD